MRRTTLRKFLSIALTVIALLVVAVAQPALAADSTNGGKIFGANCASCHMGGNNMVMAQKTLKKDALEQFGMNSSDAIVTQVTNGKNAMPSFKGRLTNSQIQDVAAYVLQQADKGWPG